MNPELDATLPDASPPRAPVWRVASFASLFLAQFMLLSLRVDALALASIEDGWVHLLGYAGQFSRFVLGFAAAFLIAAWPRLPAHWSTLLRAAASYRWIAVAAAQLASFAAFYALTVRLFGTGAGAPGGALALSWMLAAALTLILALACLAPAAFWWQLLRAERWMLLLAGGFGALIWLVARGTQTLWGPLAEWTFRVSSALISLVYPEAELVSSLETRQLGTQWFYVNIAPACSGYEGIGLVTGFLALYFSLFRKELRFPQALLLFPLGIFAIWLFNAVRIAVLIMIGASWSPDVALGGFHSQAGWITFTAVALALIWLIDRSIFFTRHDPQRATAPRQVVGPAAAMLAPLLMLLAATLLTSALTAHFDWLYPLRVIATAAVLWWYRKALLVPGYRPVAAPVLAGCVVFVLWLLLVPAAPEADRQFGTTLEQAPGWLMIGWLLFRSIGSVLTVPLAEELAFRGYLLSRLCGREPALRDTLPVNWFAVLASSLAFGLLHGAWIAGALAGLVYAWVRYRRGHVLDAVLAHAVTNGLVTAYVLFTGNWEYW